MNCRDKVTIELIIEKCYLRYRAVPKSNHCSLKILLNDVFEFDDEQLKCELMFSSRDCPSGQNVLFGYPLKIYIYIYRSIVRSNNNFVETIFFYKKKKWRDRRDTFIRIIVLI